MSSVKPFLLFRPDTELRKDLEYSYAVLSIKTIVLICHVTQQVNETDKGRF